MRSFWPENGVRERSPVAFVGKAPGVAGAHSDSGLAGDVTGNAPVPVPAPITSLRHFHGSFSFGEICVCPKVSRKFLDGFFLHWPNRLLRFHGEAGSAGGGTLSRTLIETPTPPNLRTNFYPRGYPERFAALNERCAQTRALQSRRSEARRNILRCRPDC